MPKRVNTLLQCVSTGKEGTLKHSARTTEAVFIPTPGRETKSDKLEGTCPSYLAMSNLLISNKFLALFLYNPIDLIIDSISFISALEKAYGLGKRENSLGVTRLTALSVVWADKDTATTH